MNLYDLILSTERPYFPLIYSGSPDFALDGAMTRQERLAHQTWTIWEHWHCARADRAYDKIYNHLGKSRAEEHCNNLPWVSWPFWMRMKELVVTSYDVNQPAAKHPYFSKSVCWSQVGLIIPRWHIPVRFDLSIDHGPTYLMDLKGELVETWL